MPSRNLQSALRIVKAEAVLVVNARDPLLFHIRVERNQIMNEMGTSREE